MKKVARYTESLKKSYESQLHVWRYTSYHVLLLESMHINIVPFIRSVVPFVYKMFYENLGDMIKLLPTNTGRQK